MSTALPQPVVVVGCGYVGRRLLSSLPPGGGIGVSRTQPPDAAEWLCVDLDTDPLDDLVKACGGAVLYYFLAPSTKTDQDDRSRRLLQAMSRSSASPVAVVLISTTGVYGDCAGAWVDEHRPLMPVATRALRRADAEKMWSEYGESAGVPVAILRTAGIYGPGKLPVARLSKSQPLLLGNESPWSNRVHVDDLVDTAMAVAGSEAIVNVSDGTPSTMTAYFHALADALGVARLPELCREQLEAQWTEGLSHYMVESRRIDNSRMRELLGGSLRYPCLVVGLAACLKGEPS